MSQFLPEEWMTVEATDDPREAAEVEEHLLARGLTVRSLGGGDGSGDAAEAPWEIQVPFSQFAAALEAMESLDEAAPAGDGGA